MALNAVEIGRVVAALQPWVGAQLQGIHQPEPTVLIITARRPGETGLFKFVCRGARTRGQQISKRPANPSTGHSFQQLCRKELLGRITEICQINDDRVVRVQFQGQARKSLVFELTGRHGNAFVLDPEGLILGSMLPNLSQQRPLIAGQAWAPPPPPNQQRTPPTRFSTELTSPQLLAEIARTYDALDESAEFDGLKTTVGRHLRSRIRKQQKLLSHLEKDLEKAAAAQDDGRLGDLLQIHLRTLHKGMTEFAVDDIFEDPPKPTVIALRPELGPKENMARYYRRARRYQGAVDSILERAAATEEALAEAERIKADLDKAETVEAIQLLAQRESLSTEGSAKSRKRRKKPRVRLPYHAFMSTDGFEIRVGRGAKDNDALTFRHAKGNDIWLHIRGGPGAHVVVPCHKGQAPLNTLIEAAALALRYGGRKMGDDGEVAYTRAKYVRRVPGGAPGRVTYSQEKALSVRLVPELMERIKRVEA